MPVVIAMTASAESERGLRLGGQDARATVAIAAALFLVTAALFAPAIGFDFVNYDDDVYVYENAPVRAGLSWAGVRWAFGTFHAGNWHPLTWLSLMTDVSLFGEGPRGHHLVNVLLHAVNASLLFVALRRLTGDIWPAAACAGLFALHPQRVESVAWISERKDVLSGLFWMLALLAYDAWRRRRTVAAYAVLLGTVGLGLLAKPIVVVLPGVLLLLDVWTPIGRRRVQVEPVWAWLVDKLPLVVLAAVSAAATVWAQSLGGSVSTTDALPVTHRLMNVAYAAWQYSSQLVWPTGLAPFYPHPFPPAVGRPPGAVAQAALGAGLIVVSLCLIIVCARRAAWVTAGLGWSAITLLPVIGLVQVGLQSHADRYTYLPSIGIGIALAWTLSAVGRWARWAQVVTDTGFVSILVAHALVTSAHLHVWRDSETLWRHAAGVRPSAVAFGNLGQALLARGETASAEAMYRKAVALDATSADGHYGLAICLMQRGDDASAKPLLERVIHLDAGHATARLELAKLHARQGRRDEAVAELRRLLAIRPNSASGRDQLALMLAQSGEFAEAVEHWKRVEALRPGDAGVLHNLGAALLACGRTGEGLTAWRRAVAIDPTRAETTALLGWTLATTPDAGSRNPSEALEWARRAVELTGRQSVRALDALAAAQAAQGDFESAVESLHEAMRLPEALRDARLAGVLRERAEGYRTGRRPWESR